MFDKMPKIYTRKYLTEDELADYDGMVIAAAFSDLTVASAKAIKELERTAYARYAKEMTEKGYVLSTKDRVAGWFANKFLRFASPEYQFLLWVCFRFGMDQLDLKLEST